MGMWESRVLCEISKSLWESFCDFHRNAISTATASRFLGYLLSVRLAGAPEQPGVALFLAPVVFPLDVEVLS